MKYVIIGNSAAAAGCVAGVRGIDTESPITVISDERHGSYSRPLISYWMCGKVTDENMSYRDSAFFEKNNCSVIEGRKAVKIISVKKAVVLDDNQWIEYDRLLVATGSLPFVPPISGMETVGKVFTFLNWDSAEDLRNAVDAESKVVIMGAGLIGLKAAEGLHGMCAGITVVDLADRVLPSILDTDGAGIIQKHIESKGIRIILNDAADSVSANELKLRSGTILPFDVLVVAVGVRPNTALAKEAGSTVNKGIITDDHMRTSLSGVYAAGDCVESYDISTGQSRVLALLPNAYIQGETAGINMAGGDASFKNAIPMNSIGFFGLHIISAGSMDGECEVWDTGQSYRKLSFSDNRLKGYIMIGDVDRAGIYTSLIREQTPLDEVDSDILKSSPQMLIFSKAVRKQKMAGGA